MSPEEKKLHDIIERFHWGGGCGGDVAPSQCPRCGETIRFFETLVKERDALAKWKEDTLREMNRMRRANEREAEEAARVNGEADRLALAERVRDACIDVVYDHACGGGYLGCYCKPDITKDLRSLDLAPLLDPPEGK